MGVRGPVPKRAAERAGHRAKDDRPDTTRIVGKVRVPAASKAWHPQAIRWYRSLRKSGQRHYFEPSDWAEAQLLAELLTRELTKQRVVTLPTGLEVIVQVAPGAAMLRTILAGMAELGTTENARRRMRIEIERVAPPRPGDAGDDVFDIDDYRAAAAG